MERRGVLGAMDVVGSVCDALAGFVVCVRSSGGDAFGVVAAGDDDDTAIGWLNAQLRFCRWAKFVHTFASGFGHAVERFGGLGDYPVGDGGGDLLDLSEDEDEWYEWISNCIEL